MKMEKNIWLKVISLVFRMITEIELNENSLKHKDKRGMDQGLKMIIYLQSYLLVNCSKDVTKNATFFLMSSSSISSAAFD